MQINHTPGQWTVFEGKQTWIEAPGSNPATRVTIATIHETSTKLNQSPRAPHDAQLIASAPELLQALNDIANYWTHGKPLSPSAIISAEDKPIAEIVCKAIAKASVNLSTKQG